MAGTSLHLTLDGREYHLHLEEPVATTIALLVERMNRTGAQLDAANAKLDAVRAYATRWGDAGLRQLLDQETRHECGRIHPSDCVRALGRFLDGGSHTYRADYHGAPIRFDPAEAEADWCHHHATKEEPRP